MRAVKKQSGFTLTEIVVSITLIPLLWFALYIAMSINTMLVSQSKHRAQVVFITQQNMDMLRTNGYAGLSAVSNQNVTIDTRGTADAADDLIGAMSIALGAPAGGGHYRQVTITANWMERTFGGPDRMLTESLTTFISDDLAG